MDVFDAVERSADFPRLNGLLRLLRGERLLRARFVRDELTLQFGPPYGAPAGLPSGLARGAYGLQLGTSHWRIDALDAQYDSRWIASRADPEAARRDLETWADGLTGLCIHEVQAAPASADPAPADPGSAAPPTLRLLFVGDDAFLLLDVEPAAAVWALATPFERRLTVGPGEAWSYLPRERQS